MKKNNNSLKHRCVNLGETNLDYYWGSECVVDIVQSISKIDTDKYFIVTDNTVYDLYGKELEKKLSEDKPTFTLKTPAGERYKTIEVLTSYFDQCFSKGITRHSLIIGLGGGVPGNIAGLLASLIYRGIKFIQVPTTSMAMFDSVLSLKQAINSGYSKNAIGSFYKPSSIFIDLNMLTTLPENQRRSGLCETIKNSLAIAPEQIDLLKANLKKAYEGDFIALNYILESSINAKERIMSRDTYEKLDAIVLEYGHTVGHAIELLLSKSMRFSVSHGEAVGLGMIIAARLSNKLGFLDDSAIDIHYNLLEEISSPTAIDVEFNYSDIIKLLQHDNKRGYIKTRDDEAAMILLKNLGEPLYTGKYPLKAISCALIEEVLKATVFPRKYVV